MGLLNDNDNDNDNEESSRRFADDSLKVMLSRFIRKPKKATKRFIQPTIEQVAEYCKERNNKVDPELFWHHYNGNGWMKGETPMKNWKSTVVTWERNSFDNKKQPDSLPGKVWKV